MIDKINASNYSPPNVNYWGDRCCRAEAEIERLRADRDALVLVIMRGSHREARDLARLRFVEMHPEEKGHAAKLARASQQNAQATKEG